MSRNSKYKLRKSGVLWPLLLVYFPLTSHSIIGSSVSMSVKHKPRCIGTVKCIVLYGEVNWLFNDTINNISVIYVTAIVLYTIKTIGEQVKTQRNLAHWGSWETAGDLTTQLFPMHCSKYTDCKKYELNFLPKNIKHFQNLYCMKMNVT